MSATAEALQRWLEERRAVSERVQLRIEAERTAGVLPPHPAPEEPCRLAEDSDMGTAAKALRRAAEGAGARVQVTYARGWGTHGTTGRPTSLVHSIAVRCWGPAGRRLVAVWTRPVRDGSKWTCDLRWTWSETEWIRSLTDAGMKAELAMWAREAVR